MTGYGPRRAHLDDEGSGRRQDAERVQAVVGCSIAWDLWAFKRHWAGTSRGVALIGVHPGRAAEVQAKA